MVKTRFYYLIAFIVLTAFLVSGCETVPKKFRQEVSDIRTRVDTLESKVEGVESKQSDVERATSEQAQTLEEMKAQRERATASRTNISVAPRHGKDRASIRTKDIQLCLKNAGFYSGAIDGIKGKNTRKAICEFQKANGLNPDGVVGKKTWEVLARYAEAPAAARAASAVEGETK